MPVAMFHVLDHQREQSSSQQYWSDASTVPAAQSSKAL
jgi:hypothetical protein